MPAFEVSAPDGRKFRIEGDKPPTEEDLDRIFQASPQSESSSVDAALGAFNQMHPDITQGPRLQQPDSLAPALPPTITPEPKLPVPELRQYEAPPRGIESALSGVGTPIEEPPDFHRLPLGQRMPETPLEVLQVPTKMPFPRMQGTGVLAGAEHFVADVADFITSPAGFATALAPEILAGSTLAAPIGRGIATAYAADMARQLPDTFSGVVDALEKGDKAEATRLLLNAGASTLLIGGATRANLKAGQRYATQKRIEQQSRQQQYPGTEAQRLQTIPSGSNRPKPVAPGQAPNVPKIETPPATPGEVAAKAVERQPLTPQVTDAEYADAERQAIAEAEKQGSPVKVVDEYTDENAPFNNRFIARAFKHGIEINRGAFRQWLAETPPDHREEAIKAVMSEEHIHRHVTDEDAKAYLETLTSLEKSAESYLYTGYRNLDRANEALGVKLDDTALGHEAIRRRLQKLYGGTPTEIAEAALNERWKLQTVDALSTVLRKAREAIGTEAAGRGVDIIERAQKNLDFARSALVAKQTADEQGLMLDTTPQSGGVKFEGVPEELRAKMEAALPKQWAFTDPASGLTFYTKEGATPKEILDAWKSKQEAPAALRRGKSDEKTAALPLLPGATREDRAAATELGAEAVTPQKIASTGYEHLTSETDRVTEAYTKNPDASIKPPSFEGYVEDLKRKYGDVQPGQLYEIFSDNLYKRLLNASGKTLEALQRSIGVKVKGRIPDPPQPKALLESAGATPQARAQMRAEATGAASRLKYRFGAIRMIADKLLGEARETLDTEAKSSRSTISAEDIRYKGQPTQPPFFDISTQDLQNPGVLSQRLTADSRRSKRDPVSLTKRVTALLDKQTGKVYLVSTYPHGRTGAMLVDPSLSTVRAHKPLSQILTRYRPVASMLLDEPVRGFRQSFDSLGDFESKLGTDARRASRDAIEAPLAEGQAPQPGVLEEGGPLTDAEVSGVLDHITAEVGRFDTPEDVKASLEALREKPNFQVISGYRKLAAELQRRNPDLSDVGVINQLAQNIYENHVAASQPTAGETPFEAFRRRTLSQGGAGYREDVATTGEPRPSETGRELTMPIERRPPTDVRPENIPAEEAAKLRTKAAPAVPEGSLAPAKSAPGALRRYVPQSIQDDVDATAKFIADLAQERVTKDTMARMVDDMTNLPNNQARQVEQGIRVKSIEKKPSLTKRVLTQWQHGDKKILAAAKTLVYSGSLRTTGTIDIGHAQTEITRFQSMVDSGITDAKAMMKSGSLFERRKGRIKLRAANQLKDELNYAESHLTDKTLIDTAHRVRQENDRLYAALKAAGETVNYKDNFIPGRYDIAGTDGRQLFMQEPRIIGTKFREPKVFNNYYEAIAVPGEVYVPATVDAASLTGNAVRKGMQLIQKKQTEGFLKAMTAPDGNPLAVDAETRGGPGAVLVPPKGYGGYEVVGGIAVHPHFAGAWRSLTGRSFIEDTPVLRQALHLTQGLKHSLLIGDLFHLGRISYYAASLMRSRVGFKGGWSALDFQDRDLNAAVKKGFITQGQADWSRTLTPFGSGQITHRELLTRSQMGGVGFNIGRIQDALYKDVFTQLTPTAGVVRRGFAKLTDPTTGRYNRFLFDKYTRGLMAESFVNEFERQQKAMPNANPQVLMRDIARDINNYYGNIGRQGFFRSKSMQDLARLFWLAPQWVEGLIKKETVGATRITAGSLAEASKRLGVQTPYRKGKASWGATGTGVATGLTFMFGLAQAINLISRGKPTWQNEEKGHAMDAYVPIGDGFWFSPFSIFAEMFDDLWRISHTKPKFMDALDQIAGNKESPLSRAILIGAPLGIPGRQERFTTSLGQLKAAGKQLLPIPISLSKVAQKAGHAVAPSLVPPPRKGTTLSQLVQSTGAKLHPAESSYQRISAIAKDFMQAKGYQKETGWASVMTDADSYTKLRSQIRNGDDSGARSTFLALKANNRTSNDIVKAMRLWAKHPFTGAQKYERDFIKGLTDKELDLYSKAEQERFQTYSDFIDFIIKEKL